MRPNPSVELTTCKLRLHVYYFGSAARLAGDVGQEGGQRDDSAFTFAENRTRVVFPALGPCELELVQRLAALDAGLDCRNTHSLGAQCFELSVVTFSATSLAFSETFREFASTFRVSKSCQPFSRSTSLNTAAFCCEIHR